MSLPLSLDFTLESENLRLRAPHERDLPEIFQATRYPGFHDGMAWEAPQNIEELVPNLRDHLKAWQEGKAYGFAIDWKKNQAFAGRISIRPTQEDDIWDIGYWTHPRHQRKGLMSEALALVLNFGKEYLHARAVVAAFATWNKASERVLRKNGFVYDRYVEKGLWKQNSWVAEIYMIHHL